MSTIKLAKKYRCCSSTINQRLNQAGINVTNIINLPEEEICKKYKNGMNSYQLAEEYKCSIQPILRVLRDNNIKIRSNFESHIGSIAGEKNIHYIDLPMEEICKKYLDGKHPYELAEEYGCSAPTIFVKLKQNNIYIRTIKDVNNLMVTCICSKCGHKYEGKQSSRYCPDCSPNEYCYKFDETCREQNREKYDRECFFCGKSEEETDRKHCSHHIDYNKNQGCDGTPDWKLVPLCSKCHGMTNGGVENRKIWEARILYLHNEYWNNILIGE